MLSATISVAGQETKAIKRVQQSFKVNKQVSLELTNKYGQVILNTWSRDSILVKVKVTGYGRDRDAAENMLERVEFEFNQVGEYVIIETVLDRSKGFFKDLWNSISDYSKSLLGKTKLSIDFEIFMPVTGNIDINQKFGDIYLDDTQGNVSIDLSNGNLKIHELTKDFNLDLSFGRANINTMKSGLVSLRSAELEVEKASDIELKSSSSTVIINQLNSLKMDSRSDKIRMDELATLRGDGSFSTINIKLLKRAVLADLNYGELIISQVSPDFRDLQLKGRSTDFDLMFQEQALIDLKIVGLEEEITLADGQYERSRTGEDEKFTEVKGTIGEGTGKRSTIDIYADGGRVKLMKNTASKSSK